MSDVILRLPAVIAKTGLRRSAIYLRIKAGGFRPVRLGPRAIGFFESEINAWITSRQRVVSGVDRGSGSKA